MKTSVRQILAQKGCNIITIPSSATVFAAIQTMVDNKVGSLIVKNSQGKMAGIFVERDCFRKVILAERNPKEVKVGDVMTKKVIYATLETGVEECMALMTEKRIRHLPVMDDKGEIMGIVSIGDMVKYVSAEQATLIGHLEKYIEGSL